MEVIVKCSHCSDRIKVGLEEIVECPSCKQLDRICKPCFDCSQYQECYDDVDMFRDCIGSAGTHNGQGRMHMFKKRTKEERVGE